MPKYDEEQLDDYFEAVRAKNEAGTLDLQKLYGVMNEIVEQTSAQARSVLTGPKTEVSAKELGLSDEFYDSIDRKIRSCVTVLCGFPRTWLTFKEIAEGAFHRTENADLGKARRAADYLQTKAGEFGTIERTKVAPIKVRWMPKPAKE
jgi:hypothetical protein